MKRKIPKIFKNFYFITSLIFVLWIAFFDSNDLITQYNRVERLEKLESEKNYYETEIKKIEREQKALATDSQAIERFAREKFYLKKPKEEVFVIEEEEDTEKEY